MSLRGFLSGLVALARRAQRKPYAYDGGTAIPYGKTGWEYHKNPSPDRADHAVFVGDASTGNVFEFRADQPALERPAQPRPPSVGEMAEGKRP